MCKYKIDVGGGIPEGNINTLHFEVHGLEGADAYLTTVYNGKMGGDS